MQSWNCTSRFKSHLLLIWNFQMRLEMRCAIWNFWNFLIWNFWNYWNFSNLWWRVAYLKLSDETWNEMCYLKLLKLYDLKLLKLLKLFKPMMEGCLFETFRSDETWNEMCYLKLFQPITGVAYLKLSDETWKEICYLKHLKFEPWNCLNISWELFIWNFQMRLKKRYAMWNIWNVWNLKLFKHIIGVVFWNFQMRLEKRCDIQNFRNLKLFKLFKPIKGVIYLKLLDETWNEMCYLKIFKLSNPLQGLLIWNFQMRLERRYAIWNIWSLNLETV